ncbi:YrpD family protein [Paenibacillus alba]|uniref:YrpD family protein n=1 Tax=Paenibacillus alba TaxID=1197127 RepID=A0ABU6GE91_9BACL|nr:YrpD family protein [Paenibacillus alba]MEC0231970.1 YrpD family protein [Paenibacillus alba]
MKKKIILLTVVVAVMTSMSTVLAEQSPAATKPALFETGGAEVTDYTNMKSAGKVEAVLSKARQAAAEETGLAFGARSVGPGTETAVNYVFIDGNTGYFYEKSPIFDREKLYVYEVKAESLQNSPVGVEAALVTDLPNGIGGKAVVNKNGSYINATVRTAVQSQLSGAPSGATYIYSGFSGTGRKYDGTNNNFPVEADMGLQYSNAYGYVKWTPVLGFYNGIHNNGSFLSGYEKVQYKNGFKGGTDVNLTAYRNVNGNTRLSISGYAVCPDSACSQTADTYLTSIMEFANTNVTSVSKWKMLATIAGSENVTGHIYTEFKNVNLDGAAQTPTKEAEDYATVSISGSTVTINVSHD